MRVGFKWLGELVAIDASPSKIAELLTLSGTKVEAIHTPGESIKGVIVAEVLGIGEHPNADNLVLVDVRVDDADTRRVVCGARNFSVGDHVALAQVGATLPEMAVSERAIRGEISQGMLCSGAELGVSKDHSGILVLPPDSVAGDEVVTALGLDDTVLEFEITFNRPDCLGMIGIAREVAALTGAELRMPDASFGVTTDMASPVEVEIRDPSGCPRYVAGCVEGVATGPSPGWIAARLSAAGLRPISNVVDITNYVLLETGHPIHAFDAAKVGDHHIVVRRATGGERIRTLDGVERTLDAADLVIADPSRALAMAGVMGGGDSEVTEGTAEVIVESAYFDPASVAGTSRRHLLRTEASARFERGADFDAAPYAAARATKLLAELTGGRPAGEMTDAYPVPLERRSVSLAPQKTEALLGMRIPASQQVSYLESLGFRVTMGDATLAAEAPSFRPDIQRDVDLIEEVARLAGFDRLPSTLPRGVAGGLDGRQAAERRLCRTLAATGLHEAWTTSWASERDLDALGLSVDHPARKMVEVANPMSDDERHLRTTLLPGLLRSAAHNLAHRVEDVALFEIARIYTPTGGLPQEPLLLGAVFSGLRRAQTWHGQAERWSFWAAKGLLEAVLTAMGVRETGWSKVTGMPWHPTRAANVTAGEATLGTIGELHPDVCERFRVEQGTVVAELALGPLVDVQPGRVKVRDLPRFPAAYMDLAVVVEEAVPAQTVETIIRHAGAPELVEVRLFDLYRGEQVPEGHKSLAYGLELRAPDKTLTDAQASEVRDRVIRALHDQAGAELRA
ncbi:MAG: phenylalanine--tRNA ligase subunit beta [Actinomycetota bacterium]|nr:phenylalanine--tRNA ligase subunit beta [Actinomycetota bacterium]